MRYGSPSYNNSNTRTNSLGSSIRKVFSNENGSGRNSYYSPVLQTGPQGLIRQLTILHHAVIRLLLPVAVPHQAAVVEVVAVAVGV